MPNDNLTRQLRKDEDARACVYRDSSPRKLLTIGVGRLVDDRVPGAGLRPVEIDFLLANDIEDRTRALTAALPWFGQMNEARQGVFLNMAFQLGVAGFLAFTRTIGHARVGDYEDAADEMLLSDWALQTPARAKRMSQQMRTGEWVFEEE